MIEIDQKKVCEFCKKDNYKTPFPYCTPGDDICTVKRQILQKILDTK